MHNLTSWLGQKITSGDVNPVMDFQEGWSSYFAYVTFACSLTNPILLMVKRLMGGQKTQKQKSTQVLGPVLFSSPSSLNGTVEEYRNYQ